MDIKFRFYFYDVNVVEVNFCLSFFFVYLSDKNKVNFRFYLKIVIKVIFLYEVIKFLSFNFSIIMYNFLYNFIVVFVCRIKILNK